MTRIFHDSFTLERSYDTSVQRVFSALSSTRSRARWGAPSADEALEFENSDFRIGGLEVSHCGPKGNLMFRVETHYLAVVPNVHIVFSENVSGPEGPLSASLLSFELEGDSSTARLRVTGQIASFVGADMINGNRNGLSAALTNLSHDLAENGRGDIT